MQYCRLLIGNRSSNTHTHIIQCLIIDIYDPDGTPINEIIVYLSGGIIYGSRDVICCSMILWI